MFSWISRILRDLCIDQGNPIHLDKLVPPAWNVETSLNLEYVNCLEQEENQN